MPPIVKPEIGNAHLMTGPAGMPARLSRGDVVENTVSVRARCFSESITSQARAFSHTVRASPFFVWGSIICSPFRSTSNQRSFRTSERLMPVNASNPTIIGSGINRCLLSFTLAILPAYARLRQGGDSSHHQASPTVTYSGSTILLRFIVCRDLSVLPSSAQYAAGSDGRKGGGKVSSGLFKHKGRRKGFLHLVT